MTQRKKKQTCNPYPFRFPLGRVVATPGADDLCTTVYLGRCLARHGTGDWGCVDPEHAAKNDKALAEGGRILSIYPRDPSKPYPDYSDNPLWIITEADRSVTTLLLWYEY